MKTDNFKIAAVGFDSSDASRKGPFTVSVEDFGCELSDETEGGAGASKAKVEGLGVQVDKIALGQPGNTAPRLG